MSYQVGELDNIRDDDPVFEDRAEAERVALATARFGAEVMGVWTSQEEGSDLVSLAYEGELFTK